MEEQPFFVGVRNPTEMRKDILVTSKDIIMSLKNYEQINDIRTQKVEMTSALKDRVKEAKMLLNQLVALVPKTKLHAKPDKQIKRKLEKDIVMVKKDANSELDKLERELADIENKIGGLE
jgi:hypothetical protein